MKPSTWAWKWHRQVVNLRACGASHVMPIPIGWHHCHFSFSAEENAEALWKRGESRGILGWSAIYFPPPKSLDTKDALRAWDPPGVLVLDIAHRQFMPFRLSRCLIQESKRADNYFPIWAGLNPQCLSRCKCHTHQRPIFVHAHLRLSDITIACLETFMHGVPESSECIRTPEIA